MARKPLNPGPRRTLVWALSVAALTALVAIFAGGATARTSEMPSPRQPPTITGTPQEGNTLTANNGQWLYLDGRGCGSECVYTYQWERCGSAGCPQIAGATNRTYTLTAADVGFRIRVANTNTKYDCDATNKNCRYVSSGQYSSMTAVVTPKAVARPTATTPPTITGLASEREVLSVDDGGWTGPTPITTARQWTRCDVAGNDCSHISGATAPTYTVTADDVGHTLRVTATATNAGGSTSSTSAPTAVVTPLAPRPGRNTLTISDVSLPQRLVVDQIRFSANPLRSRAPFTARFRVRDTRGFLIGGALVQVVPVPFGLIRAAAEVETEPNGWATLTLRPTARLQLRDGGSLVLFVRARKPGENPLAGVSTRRLVRVKLAAPTG
jgi:hypothetical protein